MIKSWILSHLVPDWRDFHKWASMRLHGLAMLVAAVYQVMPTLDPQIAAMLPAPVVAKAIGLYAMLGALSRIVQLRQPPAQPYFPIQPPHA